MNLADLSSSVTPPEIVDEGETKVTGQIDVNCDEGMQPSTSHKNCVSNPPKMSPFLIILIG